MVKAQAEAEHRRLAVETEPDDWRFNHDPQLVFRAAMMYERNDFARLPLPEEVAAIPQTWLDDVQLMLHLLQFQRDGLKE